MIHRYVQGYAVGHIASILLTSLFLIVKFANLKVTSPSSIYKVGRQGGALLLDSPVIIHQSPPTHSHFRQRPISDSTSISVSRFRSQKLPYCGISGSGMIKLDPDPQMSLAKGTIHDALRPAGYYYQHGHYTSYARLLSTSTKANLLLTTRPCWVAHP
jgi:hypothetical protein